MRAGAGFGFVAICLGGSCAAGSAHAQDVEVLGGVHVGGPTRASVSLGQFWFDTAGWGARRGPVVLGELGLRGHRVALGYLAELGARGSYASARLAWLRLRRGRDAGLAGLEFQVLPAFLLGGRIGVFLPLGRAENRGPLVIGNVSFGI